MSSFRQLMMKGKGNSNIIYAPALDGTEQITTISGENPPTIINNTFGAGSGWLKEGWDNTILWKLECYVTSDGFADGGVAIVLPTATNYDQNDIKVTADAQISVFNNSSRYVNNDQYFHDYNVRFSSTPKLLTIEKLTNTTFSITIDSYSKTYAFPNLSATNKLCVGVAQWSNWANIRIKDIVVTKV